MDKGGAEESVHLEATEGATLQRKAVARARGVGRHGGAARGQRKRGRARARRAVSWLILAGVEARGVAERGAWHGEQRDDKRERREGRGRNPARHSVNAPE